MTAWVIAAGALGAIVLVALLIYNGLVRLRNMVSESWSGVDVQLRRRHDLVPNLVDTVAGYAAHEQQTLTAVTAARASAASADGAPTAIPAENELTAALIGVMALAEAYPDLMASDNFLALQRQLADVENDIAGARNIYNGNVEAFNTRLQSFPALLVARPFSFERREFFATDDTAAPSVAVTA